MDLKGSSFDLNRAAEGKVEYTDSQGRRVKGTSMAGALIIAGLIPVPKRFTKTKQVVEDDEDRRSGISV